MDFGEIQNHLVNNGLKVTPQRIAVLEAFGQVSGHPSADRIIEFIHKNHPYIATGTVYKTLETFVDKGIIRKVKTEKDVMRYDSILEKHHHIYSSQSDRIEDYFDEDLNNLLEEYFRKKSIPDFRIEDFRLHIIGKFEDEK
ncbi:MAG: transcriptional repressor [Bacteroidales bacterium]|nr:transcriptional repressor [Bacteroidales bacterium]